MLLGTFAILYSPLGESISNSLEVKCPVNLILIEEPNMAQ